MSMDFIGFTYNGKHSWRDLGIYRTSNGSRYSENLTPTLTDKTADATGRDGQYYFYTMAKNQTFSVSYVFDSLTESGLRKLKQVFNGREIHDLIFDEAPYKTWSAKVTGNSQVKHLCFTDANGDRVYRGEGTLTFTCYWPYARTSDISKSTILASQLSFPARKAVEVDLFLDNSMNVRNNFNNSIKVYYRTRTADNTDWGKEGSIIIKAKELGGWQRFTWIKRIENTSSAPLEGSLEINGDSFYYTTNNTFEYLGNSDGRNINHYSSAIFPNKREWAFESGLLWTPKKGENYGDLPVSFIYTQPSATKGVEITLKGVGSITPLVNCSNLKWDSATGLVTADEKPIPYTGNSLATIPVGKNAINVPDGGTLTYNYWYY